ncbi:hypothetical protein [Streptomyces sp. Je 1-369]|uniref:hypothetical protein n=1 Tax=Streptomyces sp. Je 1-369 TaxID=2966192 RepID=UPI0039E16DCC
MTKALRRVSGDFPGSGDEFGARGRSTRGDVPYSHPQKGTIGPGRRADLPKALATLTDAWRDPAAWEGMTRAGGLDLPGEEARS